MGMAARLAVDALPARRQWWRRRPRRRAQPEDEPGRADQRERARGAGAERLRKDARVGGMELRPTPLPASSARLAAVLDQPPAGDLFGRGCLVPAVTLAGRPGLDIELRQVPRLRVCRIADLSPEAVDHDAPALVVDAPSMSSTSDAAWASDASLAMVSSAVRKTTAPVGSTAKLTGTTLGRPSMITARRPTRPCRRSVMHSSCEIGTSEAFRCRVAHVSGVAELPRFRRPSAERAPSPRASVRAARPPAAVDRWPAALAIASSPNALPLRGRSLSLRSVPDTAGRASRFPVASESARTESPAARALLGGRASLGKRFDFVIDGGIGVRRSILAAVTFRL